MDKFEFVEYWLNPEILDEVNDKIAKNIENKYMAVKYEDIQVGINLLKSGEVEKAYNYFDNKYDDEKKMDYQNYCIAILQNYSLNDIKLEEKLVDIFFCCIKRDLFSGGLDSKIYYDSAKSHIEICNRERRMPDIVAVVKGFRYAAYLGYECAFDEIINICESNSLPNVEKKWADNWKQIKENIIKKENIYSEVKTILLDAGVPINEFQANATNTEIVSIESICNEFLSCHEKKEFFSPNKMMKYFDIPDDDKVYLAHDDTLFQTGKNGFIITDKGIYVRELVDKNMYFVSYEDFAKVKEITINNSTYYIGDGIIAYYSGRYKQDVLELLEKIQKCVK